MAEKYKPAAPGKRIPMPGNQADWPQEGREINPLISYENRLVADGDLVPVGDEANDPETPPTASLIDPRGTIGGKK